MYAQDRSGGRSKRAATSREKERKWKAALELVSRCKEKKRADAGSEDVSD